MLGFTLFPAADVPFFQVEITTPEGTGVAATDRVVRRVSERIAEEPGVRTRVDHAGSGGPRVFYNVVNDFERTRTGAVLVVMDEWDKTEGAAMFARLRAEFEDDPEAEIVVRNFENGPPIDAPVAIRVLGPDIGEIRRLSAEVERIIRDHPGTRDIDNPLAVERIDLDIGLDSGKAALLGVAPGEVRRAVRLALLGEEAGTYRDSEGDSYPVTVRLPMEGYRQAGALDDIHVPGAGGAGIPLGQIASPSLVSVPPQIERYQLERVNTVSAFVREPWLPGRVTSDILSALDALDLPPGYSLSVGGEAEAAEEAFGGILPIVLLAVGGIFAVLVAEFGRFRETVVVAGVIPLGLFGGLVMLWLTGNSISYMAVIGFVALIGIEIKNSILLVDFTTQLRKRGVPLRRAVEEAGEIRFLPVLLTSVTAIGGLLPLALSGAALYSPLAWVIIGGLISSTVLSRVVTPVMYLLIARRDTADAATDARFSTAP